MAAASPGALACLNIRIDVVMENNFAIVFPGQGSQKIGMLSHLIDHHSIVSQSFKKASEILGYDLWKIVYEGPAEVLNQTIYTQPAMLVSDIVMWLIWYEKNKKMPLCFAGHSLGEYAALVASEALLFEEAVSLISRRAELMQNAVPEGQGAMAVALGLSNDQIVELCDTVSSGDDRVTPANYNAPGQIVIAGTQVAVEKALVAAKEMGAKVVKKLPMSVPSHCYLMDNAANQLAKILQSVNIQSPIVPVIQNFDVMTHDDPDEIKMALAQQLSHPVRWIETIQVIVKNGVNTIIECGPGKVLTGLNKRIDSSLELISIN